MSSFEHITIDHGCFYRDGYPFYPRIQSRSDSFHSWSNGVRIPLSAALHDDLNWSQAIKQADQCVKEDKLIFWDIDFHLPHISRYDTSAFFAHGRALEELTRQVTAFAPHTFGICLYQGSLDLTALFRFSEWDESFYEWLDELMESSCRDHELRVSRDKESSSHYYRLFCMQSFTDYFHRLISFLPDNLLTFALFDTKSILSKAACAQLLSKERLGHLQAGYTTSDGIKLQISGIPCGYLGEKESQDIDFSLPTTALCLPCDSFCDRKTLHRLDQWIDSTSHPFRILCEEKLTEEWEGVDRLILPSPLSPQGKRKLQGFLAAGGEVVDLNL
jgi:hypothetical protein